MKMFTLKVPAALLALSLLIAPSFAQDKAEKLVDLKVKPDTNKTPSIKAEFAKEKRSTPKDWLEIECEVKAERSAKAKDKTQTSYPELTFKYYVFVEGPTKEKSKVLTGEVVHTNVPIDEKVHSVMYVTPGTLLAITGKNGGVTPATAKYWGVEVLLGGERVGFAASTGTDKAPWWEAPTAPSKSADLKNKSETPFASLYGDYYLDIKAR